MKLWFNGRYDDGETDLQFDTEHLTADLKRIGYDSEHIAVIIESLTKYADETDEIKTYYKVIIRYYDNGKVDVSEVEEFESPKKPENYFEQTPLCDVYVDYFDNYKEAQTFRTEAFEA